MCTDDFLEIMKAKIEQPKLPLCLGGVFLGPVPHTAIYSARLQPHHQSGTCLAEKVPTKYANWIVLACNAHDELLLAAKEAALVIKEIADAHGAMPMTGTCLPRLLAAIKRAEA